MNRIISGPLALLVLCSVSFADGDLDDKARDAAIAKAIAYLDQNVTRLPESAGTPKKQFTYATTGLVYLMSGMSRTGKSRIAPIKKYLVRYVEEVEARLKDEANIAQRSGNFSSDKLIQYTWPVAMTGLFFGELHEHGLYQAEMKKMLPRVIAILDAAQQANGGWGHHVVQQARKERPPRIRGMVIAGGGYPDTLTAACNQVAITVGALQGVRGIRKSESIPRAIDYYREAQLSNGSYGYDASQRSAGQSKSNPSRTAGAVYAMLCLGMKRDKTVEKSIDYFMDEFAFLPEGHGSSTLNLWQGALACHALGKKQWKRFREEFEPRIIAKQDEKGHLACICEKRSFAATNDSDDPFKGRAGAFWTLGAKTYTTALHAYILLLDRGNLKLHTRAPTKRTTTKRRGRR